MASYQSGSAYHADSDADDEFERSVVTSPVNIHTDSSDAGSEVHSSEHTPTTFNTPFDDGIRPRNIISEWSPEECAQFIVSLGMMQYGKDFIEHGIDGAALIRLKHDELKDMGITSAGHRLKILKDVYDIKMQQDVPVLPDDYIPLSAESNPQYEMATKDDILKLTNAIIKLRDDRIVQLETQLTKLADDSRKLRTELWPLFKMVKEREPLPYRPHADGPASPEYPETLISPPLPTGDTEKQKSGLARTFSKKLGLTSSTPKNHSPTHIPSTIPEGKPLHDLSSSTLTGLQPSAAASAASNQLTASMSGGVLPHHNHSPRPDPNSPTSPLPSAHSQHPSLTTRSYQREGSAGFGALPRYDGADDTHIYRSAVPTPLLQGIGHDIPRSTTTLGSKQSSSTISNASTLIPSREMSASVPPQSSTGRSSKDQSSRINDNSAGGSGGLDPDDPSVQIFKSFRVALDDPCWRVLPAALRKYNIQADWRQYALYIVYGDQERCVGLDEKPLALFKDLDREGKKPMFMLRKLANGVIGDVPANSAPSIRPLGSIGGTTPGGGITIGGTSTRAQGQGDGMTRVLPGGII